jgi:hypothetical protein
MMYVLVNPFLRRCANGLTSHLRTMNPEVKRDLREKGGF